MLSSVTEAIATKMVELDDEDRMKMLEGVDQMHVVAFVTWLGLELGDHDDCPEQCPFQNPKEVVEGYVEQFSKSLHKSIEMTCEANDIPYAPDPNKEVRDEILSQGNS